MDRGEDLDRFANAPQRLATARLVEDALEIGCESGGAPGHEDLAAARQPRDARGEIDRRSEVIAIALDGGPVVEADAYGRGAVATHQPMRHVEREQDGLVRVRDTQHEGVADRLHVSGAGGQLALDRLAEVRHERRCLLVSVSLRQRGEPRDVGEHEGGVRTRHRVIGR